MMTSSNGNIFRVTGHLCEEFTGHGEFPAERLVTQNFDAFHLTHYEVIVMYSIPTGEAAQIRVYIVSGLRVKCTNFQPALHRQEVVSFKDSFYTRSTRS